MDVTQLRYFVETIRAGSYRKAAGPLFLTAQGVAQSVKRLETELGVALFEKCGREIEATAKAIELYPYAEQLLAEFDALKVRALTSSPSRRQSLRKLAVTEAPQRGCLYGREQFSILINEAAPGVAISFVQNEVAIQAAEDGLVDAAIVLGNPNRGSIIALSLYTVAPYVLAGINNELSWRTVITLSELANQRVAMPTDATGCYRFLSSALTAQNVAVHFDAVGNTFEDHVRYLESGGLIFAYGQSPLLAYNHVTKLILSGAGVPEFPFFLCCKELTSDVDALVTHLKKKRSETDAPVI